MEKLIFGHKSPDTDTICSTLALAKIENLLGNNDVKPCRLGNINKETEFVLNYFNVEAPEFIEKVDENQEVILVDHNEFSQSVEGIEKAKILKVIDHHKIANFESHEPLFYLAMPVGCTSTILKEICDIKGVKIDKVTAGLMLSAIISDTLLLKSPTCTDKDINAVKDLAEIAGVNYEEYGLEMLKAGTDLSGFTSEELINIDSKSFSLNGIKYQVAQVNTASIEDVLKNQKEIENAIEKFMKENSVDLFVLMVTDILENNSEIVVLGKTEIAEKAFDVTLNNNRAFLPGVVSRKKQVGPNIDKAING